MQKRVFIFMYYLVEYNKNKKYLLFSVLVEWGLPYSIEQQLMNTIKMNHTNSSSPYINIICIKWGDAYGAIDVNTLLSMVTNNVHNFEIRFFCFTDNSEGLNKDVHIRALPVMNCPPESVKYAYQKEAGLCDDDLGGLQNERVFFFDLDVLITDSLDEMLAYPKDKDFVIINDWNTNGDHVGQASCYSWVVGTLGYVKSYYEANADKVVKKFHTASQEYLSSKIIERHGKLNFWPEPWCTSFKFHCLPAWYLRSFTEPTLPEGTKVLAFHGRPKIDDALIGRWAPPGKVPVWKKIYKTIRPSPWIRQYWK